MKLDRRAFLKSLFTAPALVGLSSSPVLAAIEDKGQGHVKDYITKLKNFNIPHKEDVILEGRNYKLLRSVVGRIRRLQSLVGYANFAMLSFDDALKYSANYSSVGMFTKDEIDFLEAVFYRSAKDYGFFGEKVSVNLTDSIASRDVTKVRGSGHYLFRGEPLRLYNKIRRDVGRNVVLTSGVRGVVKQMYLFLNKAINSKGNLSMASRSLAPPGHSFHGVGDFDVGKRGYGYKNFTEDFSRTYEFKRLLDLGYVRIRYPENNPFGVRYEPWHIKVVKA